MHRIRKRFRSMLEATVFSIALLILLSFLCSVYVVSREGDRLTAITEELKANPAINLLVTGELSGKLISAYFEVPLMFAVDEDDDNHIEVLHALTHIHCPFFMCSSKKPRVSTCH